MKPQLSNQIWNQFYDQLQYQQYQLSELISVQLWNQLSVQL